MDGVIKSLLKRLIKVTGVKESLENQTFTEPLAISEYFGINSLADLPPVEDISKTFSGGSGSEQYDDDNTELNQINEEQSAEETRQSDSIQ